MRRRICDDTPGSYFNRNSRSLDSKRMNMKNARIPPLLSPGQARPIVLDVTLRDGGYINQWQFTPEQVDTAIRLAALADVDLIEVGYVDDQPDLPEAASCPPAMLKRARGLCGRSKLAGMIRSTVANPAAVLNARVGLLDLLRIPLDMRSPEPALKLGRICTEHGFAYTFNFVGVTCFELARLSEVAARIPADVQAIYLADSRGHLQLDEVAPLIGVVRKAWSGPIGFHAHDNLGLAMANSEAALAAGCELIDASIAAVGLGGRNLHIRDGMALAMRQRQDLHPDSRALEADESRIGLPAPGEAAALYRLTGERNLRMEWVHPMIDCFGLALAEILIRDLPSRFWFNTDELIPFLGRERWEQIKW
jgi:4-hydroxy 2-oxovalerate aldolase